MQYDDVKNTIMQLKDEAGNAVRWLDEKSFIAENNDLMPGAILSKYGYAVIATTIGGNCVVVDESIEVAYFADHTGWYDESMTRPLYNDYSAIQYSAENVKSALVPLFEIKITNPVGKLVDIRDILVGLD